MHLFSVCNPLPVSLAHMLVFIMMFNFIDGSMTSYFSIDDLDNYFFDTEQRGVCSKQKSWLHKTTNTWMGDIMCQALCPPNAKPDVRGSYRSQLPRQPAHFARKVEVR